MSSQPAFNSLATALAPVLQLVPRSRAFSDLIDEIRRAGYTETTVIDGGGNPRTLSSFFANKAVSSEVKAKAIELFETGTHDVCLFTLEGSDGNVSHRIRSNSDPWIGFLAVSLRKAEAKTRNQWLTGEQMGFKLLSSTGRLSFLPQWYLGGNEVRAGSNDSRQSLLNHADVLGTIRTSIERFIPKGQKSVDLRTFASTATPVIEETNFVPLTAATFPRVNETGEEREMRFSWRETRKRNPRTGEETVKKYMQASRLDNMHGIVAYQVPEGSCPMPNSGETWQFLVGPVQFHKPGKDEKPALTVYVAELQRFVPYMPKGKTASDFEKDPNAMLVGLPGGNGTGRHSKGRLSASLRRKAAEARQATQQNPTPKSDKKGKKGGKNNDKKNNKKGR